MKRITKIIFVIALVLFLTSCSKNDACKVIDENSSDLTQSMQNFFASETDSYGESSNFMAKIISFDKLAYEDSDIGSKYIYKMIVVVAPRCDQNIEIDYFSFSLSDEVEEYYANFPWLASYSTFNISLFDGFELPVISGIDDAQAYRFDLVFDNAGNDNMIAYGLSDDDFDEMIKDLSITISCNGKSDTINITYQNDINFYQTLEDIPANRNDLIELFNGDIDSQHVGSYFTEMLE